MNGVPLEQRPSSQPEAAETSAHSLPNHAGLRGFQAVKATGAPLAQRLQNRHLRLMYAQ